MFKNKDTWRGVLVEQLALPSPWEGENLASNPGCVLFFFVFFIENNLSYLVGGNITSVVLNATAGGNITLVAISTTAGGNITSVAPSDTCCRW